MELFPSSKVVFFTTPPSAEKIPIDSLGMQLLNNDPVAVFARDRVCCT